MSCCVFDSGPGKIYDPISVLVIAVGKYVGHNGAKSHFAELPGIEKSAIRAASTWRSAALDGRLAHRSLQSIRLLISSETIGDTSFGTAVMPATSTNVKAAIHEWLAEINERNGFGVLHWIGHGVVQHEVARAGSGDILPCEDSTEVGQTGLYQPSLIRTLAPICVGRST